MTVKEAIKQLSSVTIYHQGECTREALDMAIEALEKQIPKKMTNFAIDNNGGQALEWEGTYNAQT